MESNFRFLTNHFPDFYKLALEAERHLFIAPRTCAIYARLTFEEMVRWMFEYDDSLVGRKPEKATLEGLMYHPAFKQLVDQVPHLLDGLTLVRKIGNQAVHSKAEVSARLAHTSLNNLYEFTRWFFYTYEDSSSSLPLSLDTGCIPRMVPEEAQQTLRELEQEIGKIQKEAERKLEAQQKELEQLRKQVAANKERNIKRSAQPFRVNPANEQETREALIDIMLRETGWDPQAKNCAEYPVTGMPNKTGKGRCDYVLWGDNGQALAVIECKKTMRDPRVGQQQARLYANCLEQACDQRPLIFYTNGYETYFWDDTLYPPRRVAGFFTKDELEWTISKRKRRPLSEVEVPQEIAGRYYQEEGLKRIAETFDGCHRKALLVMATGTGKTRTAIALVQMLMRQGWARRVLFLADRSALVNQAKTNFVKLLPNLSCVDITREREEPGLHRMVFSTYQTMMNKIDSEREGEVVLYSPAHFDLVIIDEAHRSVYRKYQAIFRYFDALLVGLTATPKAEVDKNTYELFELEDHNPTYAYELDKAVNDGYLVPPRSKQVTISFIDRGMVYNDLSEEDKAEYEEKFYDEENEVLPDEVAATHINRDVFNDSTVDLVLNQLMQDGLKVEGGDKLGKTIIFARNHRHALFIVDRFYALYPHLGGDFIRVIDNYMEYAQSSIDDFSVATSFPQIAVSVDMLDTGIDIPEILNLVFFKAVYSSGKFWQMIGRGTRLCENIFGPGEHKKEFLILDYYGNFEFFGVNPEGIVNKPAKPVSQQLMECRIKVACLLTELQTEDEPYQQLRKELLDRLHQSVLQLNRNSFVVRESLREVDEFSDRMRWEQLSSGDLALLYDRITPLAEPDEPDELVRRFDLLMTQFALATLDPTRRTDTYADRLTTLARGLMKKAHLPDIKPKRHILEGILSPAFRENGATPPELENIRGELRLLIRALDRKEKEIVYTRLQDEITDISDPEPLAGFVPSVNYRQRVERYIRENEHFLSIRKLKNNQPITTAELEVLERLLFDGAERGTKEDFEQTYGKKPLGLFIRSIVGLEVNAAKEAFAEFTRKGNLTADQIRFIDQIIDYLVKNGTIDSAKLFKVPFTKLHWGGIGGMFEDDSTGEILNIIRHINDNAVG